jgi:PAS domain-containing protein
LFFIGVHASPEVAGRVVTAMAAQHQFIEDIPFRTQGDCKVWVSMFVSPVVADGRVIQHFASFIDISERVARE